MKNGFKYLVRKISHLYSGKLFFESYNYHQTQVLSIGDHLIYWQNMDEGVENTKSLTIRTVSSGKNNHCKKNLANTMPATQDSLSKNSLANSVSSSPNNSPLISPPSSAFVSASQSPYISPRATTATVVKESLTPPQEIPTPATTTTHPSPPVSYSGSQSDDIPSTSYNDEKLNSAPRISFSFPVPRVSFAKAPASNAKLRSCDVYIGYYGQNPNLIRFCKWLKSELEVQGIACFVADRAKYVDNQSHQIADRVICSASYGVVVVTSYTLLNHLSLEEIRFFAQKKNLIPLFFDTDANEIASMFNPHSDNKECKEAMEGLTKFHEFKLEANDGNWRYCVSKAAGILRGKLGRQSVTEKEIVKFAELPFPRNKYFVGREKEIMEIETTFFSCGDFLEQESVMSAIKSGTPGQSEGLADEESEADAMKGSKYIGLEVGRYKEPDLEAWVEPANARNYLKRQKYKKSKSGKYKGFGNSSIVCINGLSGVGKTELALEFAYRYYQRYKMVMWVGGETRHFRQNILNISLNMGLDLSADEEKKRGRIRSFDEQESEVFKRVKRELFHDMPYLLIIDNLESETEWWEGRDFHDLIPRNTGGTHVLITTRLPKVMNSDPMELQTLPLSDAMTLIKGRRKKEYSVTELEYLGKFDAKLGRSSFGLSLIGSLLSEFAIAPSALFEAVSHIQREEPTNYSSLSTSDQQFCQTSPFLIKVLSFCASLLQQSNGKRNLLASRMLQVGAWFAPAPIPATLLAVAANKMSSNKNKFEKWARISKLAFCCCSSQTWKSEDDSAFLLIRLGLARISNRQPGCWIQFHPITQMFVKWKHGSIAAKAMVRGVRKLGNPVTDSDHLWTSTFLVFGYKSEPPTVQLKAVDMILFIKRTALPLAIWAFTDFSRCNSALELLKVCTNMLEEVEKSFVSQIQDWCHGSLCCKKTPQSNQKVDEYVWEEVTLLKATLLETRAKLLLRGGHFDSGEELCRICISIRTVMLGHNHAQTLAAQETLAKLVRMRSKI